MLCRQFAWLCADCRNSGIAPFRVCYADSLPGCVRIVETLELHLSVYVMQTVCLAVCGLQKLWNCTFPCHSSPCSCCSSSLSSSSSSSSSSHNDYDDDDNYLVIIIFSLQLQLLRLRRRLLLLPLLLLLMFLLSSSPSSSSTSSSSAAS